jgi:hypothetical protein
MKSHQHPPNSEILRRRVCSVLLLIGSVPLLFPLDGVEGRRQERLVQQPSQSQFAKNGPFPLFEEPEIQAFDQLPKDQQIRLLAEEGPLLPQNSNLNNFSMRAFVKGNSPVFIDYALEPGSSAVVTISSDRAEYTLNLLQSPSVRQQISKIQIQAPSGSLRDRLIAAGIERLIVEFMKKPEMARNRVIVDLPREFGGEAQVGKLSIQAFTPSGTGPSKPANFRLYGLAMGEEAIANSANVERPTPNLHHGISTVISGGIGTTAFDVINVKPKSIKTGKGQSVEYEIHSISKFNNVKVAFYRVEQVGRVSIPRLAHIDSLGGVPEGGGWFKPPTPLCVWNGKSKGYPSIGTHNLEVRGYTTTDEGYWATARSDPRRFVVE